MPPQIAVLGWGSLLWEGGADFERWHDDWRPDGPTLNLEFSRISSSRLGALTLVIDLEHGSPATVAWCLSKRKNPEDAVADLRCREGCSIRAIACLNLATEGPHPEAIMGVPPWGRERRLDFVIWTALKSNFYGKTERSFTVANAVAHLQGLEPSAKARAAEYVWRAPGFVQTPLRTALQQPPWFAPKPPG